MPGGPAPAGNGGPWILRVGRAIPFWFRVAPVFVLLGLLLVLVVVPVEMGRRRQMLRSQIALVSPAQSALLESEAAFAYEVAVYRGYLATGDSAWFVTLRESHQRHAAAMERFVRLAKGMGPEIQVPLAQLEHHKRMWLAPPEALLAGRVSREALVPTLPAAEAHFQRVMVASQVMNFALLRVDARVRHQLRENEARENRMVGVLALGAFLIALTIGWHREAQARATAEAALRTRDDVLRVVSHDLKNPLHTIGMVAQLLTDLPMAERERKEQLQIIRRTVDRAHRLVLDLLDVARLQAGGSIHVDPSPLSCADLVRDAVETVQMQAEKKGLRLTWHVPEDIGKVLADRDRILQVFANLLGNAVKFTPEGGAVDVRARTVDTRCVSFRITDTGPGVAEADVERLFEPFWQDPSTASLGTGLGLTIAKAIVEAHGGRISVANAAHGKGTVFSFTILRAP